MNETVAGNWEHLNELLFRNTLSGDSGRYRSQEVFRGLDLATYELSSSLQRLHPRANEVEHLLLSNFRLYSGLQPVVYQSHWAWVALAQHHGLPTRLLDWTHSPLIAIHFATSNVDLFDADGVIWAIDIQKFRSLMPRSILNLLDEKQTSLCSVEILDGLTGAAGGFKELSHLGEDRDFFVLFEPPSIDERISAQRGLFSLPSTSKKPFSAFLLEHPAIFRRIIIPACLKWEVRDRLDHANVNERVLFPGLDGLTAWLRRHYRPIDALLSTSKPIRDGSASSTD